MKRTRKANRLVVLVVLAVALLGTGCASLWSRVGEYADDKLQAEIEREVERIRREIAFRLVPEPNEEDLTENPDPEHPTPIPEGNQPTPTRSGSSVFLWKPKGENDGKAVALFPYEFKLEKMSGVRIGGGDRDGEKALTTYWPEGRNGARVHSRFKKKGSKYGEKFSVLFDYEDETIEFKVKKGSKRLEKKHRGD